MDDEQILATDVLVDVDHDLAVGETAQLGVRERKRENSAGTQLSTEILHDLLRERTVRGTGEDSQVALDSFYS